MFATHPRARGALSKSLLLTLCLATAPVAAWGEEAAPAGTVEAGSDAATTAEPPPTNNGKVSFSIGSDFTTAYFFRGILQERNGFIWQPYGGVTFKLAQDIGDGVIDNIDLSLGSWNSIQSNKTFATSSPSNWFESDVLVGVTMGLWGFMSTNLTYAAYTFPNGAYAVTQELDWTTTFNDSSLLGPFALNPSVLFAFELDNTSFGNVNQEGIFVGLGAKPGMVLFEEEKYPLTLALPLSLGLSLDNYYDEGPGGRDQTFGYFDVGLAASVPLAFIPSDYGAWSASASVDYLALSGTLADVNQGDGGFWVGKAGFAFSY
jgi:hypothetical protein